MENWPKTSKNAGPGASGNCSTVHTARTQGVGQGKCFTFPAGQQVDTGFHTYGQIWSANMIQYYIDDPAHPFFVITASDLPAGDTWPFSNPDNPFFVILNIAVGGTLGEPTDTKTGSQAPMLVDYVRQYVPSAVPSPQLTAPKDIALQAGGTHGNVELDLRGKLGTGRVAFSCTTDAPRASCVVSSSDPFNNHTVDFDHSTTAKATVTVKTGGNTQEGNRADGTPPGTYTVTVNAYTVSSTDTNKPSATATLRLTVK